MGIFSKQTEPASSSSDDQLAKLAADTTNGALDTLTCLIRVLGDESFTLDRVLENDLAAVELLINNQVAHITK